MKLDKVQEILSQAFINEIAKSVAALMTEWQLEHKADLSEHSRKNAELNQLFNKMIGGNITDLSDTAQQLLVTINILSEYQKEEDTVA